MDAFKRHLHGTVNDAPDRKFCDKVFIRGGVISQLQQLDVSMNKPFKDYLKDKQETCLLSNNLPSTFAEKIKKPPASLVALSDG